MGTLGRPMGTWISIALVAVLAIVVTVLSLVALGRVAVDADSRAMDPMPTFTLGVGGSLSPEPEPAPEPIHGPGAAERFLTVSSGAWWRATAGECGVVEPTVERSTDRGGRWVDVTPRYRGLTRIGAVDTFSAGEGEMIAAEGDCTARVFRTYTEGNFWEPYEELLGSAVYLPFDDSATVALPSGSIGAPCAQPWALHASAFTLALVCDGRAWVADAAHAADAAGTEAEQDVADGLWRELPGAGVLALTVTGTDVVTAMPGTTAASLIDESCTGLAVVRFAAGSPDASGLVGCAEGVDASTPAALSVDADGALLWTGDQVVRLP